MYFVKNAPVFCKERPIRQSTGSRFEAGEVSKYKRWDGHCSVKNPCIYTWAYSPVSIMFSHVICAIEGVIGIIGVVVQVREMGPGGYKNGGAIGAGGVENGVENANFHGRFDGLGHEFIGEDAEKVVAYSVEGGEEEVEVGLEGFRGLDDAEIKLWGGR